MKKILYICIFVIGMVKIISAQADSKPDFNWGNASYFNLSINEGIFFEGKEIKLLQVKNQYNILKVGNDTVQLKVSRRTAPVISDNIKIFVADNYAVKNISGEREIHSLLTKDALICVSNASAKLLDQIRYIFPISFSDGFVWNSEEDIYLFSLDGNVNKTKQNENFGVDFCLQDAVETDKHLILAIENTRVIKITESKSSGAGKGSNVLLQSESQPEIFYLYRHLDAKSIEVKHGQQLIKGELIGAAWGDDTWGHMSFSVIWSENTPDIENRIAGIVNGFPQMLELYHQNQSIFYKSFRKGRIFFGKAPNTNGNQKNALSFEEYAGKGWLIGNWNATDRLEWVEKGINGNVRLSKTPFNGTVAKCTNPDGWYDYEINVSPGIYRIRAKVGDCELPAWQRLTFEGVDAGFLLTEKGQYIWTPEKVVRVNDGKLTLRIYLNEKENKPAGISEIVFQAAG